MPKKSFEEEKEHLFEIFEKHTPAFKYELTRQHLSEDQIEAIFPVILKYLEKTVQEFYADMKSKNL